MEMNFCRRCGSALTPSVPHTYLCTNGHTIYANTSPAVALILSNSKGEVLTIRRSIEPGKGKLDFPGGFCDGNETGEAAVAREIREEIGLAPEAYSEPRLICTGIDNYAYGSETVPVLSLIYTAKLLSNDTEIITGDDAEQAAFVPRHLLNPSELYFGALRQAAKRYLEQR